ncbi:hypothetical protein IRJ41_017455 [Triplophysa rosa]|uniref:Uncharacterized protein n=1 Tax=Triplophysa rosa TaxID=992332 RepID=A0A9W7TRP5_TRIRA|nr:hypothetical protein IRJ41_017455 [Triplophysa rosa]
MHLPVIASDCCMHEARISQTTHTRSLSGCGAFQSCIIHCMFSTKPLKMKRGLMGDGTDERVETNERWRDARKERRKRLMSCDDDYFRTWNPDKAQDRETVSEPSPLAELDSKTQSQIKSRAADEVREVNCKPRGERTHSHLKRLRIAVIRHLTPHSSERGSEGTSWTTSLRESAACMRLAAFEPQWLNLQWQS